MYSQKPRIRLYITKSINRRDRCLEEDDRAHNNHNTFHTVSNRMCNRWYSRQYHVRHLYFPHFTKVNSIFICSSEATKSLRERKPYLLVCVEAECSNKRLCIYLLNIHTLENRDGLLNLCEGYKKIVWYIINSQQIECMKEWTWCLP